MGMKREYDSTMEDPSASVSSVLCCSCGVPMVPNQTMRCAQCLKAEVSIIEGISRQVVLPQCRNCKRYSRPPWTHCEPESRELLGLCLKRVKGLGKETRLVDASFIWTEEHSKRIRVKITVQKEVANSSVLQQTMVVEFTIVNMQCEVCQRSFTPNTFNAVVQVRQKVAHRRTFCYLEQLILKHDAHDKVISLKETREGLDFNFGQRSHAQRFADFVASCVPSRQKNSKHLISHDANSNTYQYKYTILMELCPVCVDDIVHVPKGHSQLMNGAAPVMLCHKVSNCIRLVDPMTLRCYDIPTAEYWKRPFGASVCGRSHLTEYIVLNIEPIETPEAGTPAKHRIAGRGKMAMAEVEVARASDLGQNDERMVVRSHLGATLRIGQRVLGYDLRCVNVTGDVTGSVQDQRAEVVLVKKQYRKRRGKRQWELRRLAREKGEAEEVVDDEADMEAMCQDLEEDAELRRGVNLYRSAPEPGRAQQPAGGRAAAPAAEAAAGSGERGGEEEEEEPEVDEDGLEPAPEVPLAELLEGLHLAPEEGEEEER